MLSKNEIKRITALHHAKFRNERHRFLVEGTKIVHELLDSSYKIVGLYAVSEWIQANMNQLATRKEVEICEISPAILERISQLKTPNLVVAEVEIPTQTTEIDFQQPILALDSINDPGNLGTIIRTADWFGFQQIVCSENCVELYNSKVLQATMGSFMRVKMFYTDLKKWLSLLPTEKTVYGAVMNGENLYQTDFSKNSIVLIGNESKGISETLKPLISKKITIPRIGAAESLNASIATAIILNEYRRQTL